MPPKRILLTNDDGIEAPGIRALYRVLRSFGNVTVVAPTQQQSGVSHAITIDRSVEVFDHQGPRGYRGYAVVGTPADCVKVALRHLMREAPPEVVVSGMNFGANVGINVLYSGTVAAAIEGAMAGIPSFAVSLAFSDKPDFDTAAAKALPVIEQILGSGAAPPVTNINVPAMEAERIRGWRLTRQEIGTQREWFDTSVGADGRKHFHPQWTPEKAPPEDGSDAHWLEAGFITVTPLVVELTDRAWMRKLSAAMNK